MDHRRHLTTSGTLACIKCASNTTTRRAGDRVTVTCDACAHYDYMTFFRFCQLYYNAHPAPQLAANVLQPDLLG